MKFAFSFIIPVYNRPEELNELLLSLTSQNDKAFEVVIVEDGSKNEADSVVDQFKSTLDIKYFKKENTGAGLSRNYGMEMASGNYFIVLDSDCLVPANYLKEIRAALALKYTPAFGGADAAHPSFSPFQKAVSYSMTSYMTTGGLRGKKKSIDKFQPRSYNFGISKEAFEKTGGFSKMKIGEDIDLTMRLWENGLDTQFIEDGFVYHKRRTSFLKFFNQTYAFGKGRPVLNRKYPSTKKLTYWFPSLFVIFTLFALTMLLLGYAWAIQLVTLYLLIVGMDAAVKNKSVHVGFLSILTTCTQFYGYGLGFLNGYFR